MIYVASSWRNLLQPTVVKFLRDAGFEVYDFKKAQQTFHWEQIHPKWKDWDAKTYRKVLNHRYVQLAYSEDLYALTRSEALVMVTPCGNSAGIEFGYACGMGKKCAIFLGNGDPETMHRMTANIFTELDDLAKWCGEAYIRRAHEILHPFDL